MTHIDDWLDSHQPTYPGELFAKEFLEHARRPAIDQDHKWQAEHPLYCTYDGKRYRCTGASRLGDVWLASDLGRTSGYDLRVDVAQCSRWGGFIKPSSSSGDGERQ